MKPPQKRASSNVTFNFPSPPAGCCRLHWVGEERPRPPYLVAVACGGDHFQRLNMSGHSNSQNLMDKYLLLDPSGKDFTKNRLGKFNLFGRITQANDCIAILFVRQLSSSSGHPESASPKGRVKIPRSFMVNGNMDTTPHFIGWSMHQNHQISEVQKHNLTSISTQKRTTTTHSHHIVPFQSVPLFSC